MYHFEVYKKTPRSLPTIIKHTIKDTSTTLSTGALPAIYLHKKVLIFFSAPPQRSISDTMPSTMKTLLVLAFLSSAYALPTPQLAGEGAFFNALFSDTDNGVGYGIENAEDNLANTITGTKSTAKIPSTRRQLDKIANGFQAISNSAGTGSMTTSTTNMADNMDGTLTSGAANLGAQVGSVEENTLEEVGAGVPRL